MSSDRRRARGEATRRLLVDTARELFGEQGFQATSIEEVLRRAGVARGALYHHFKGKSDLFDAVAEQVFAEIAEVTGAAARGSKDPRERLRAGSRAWLEMALDPAIQRIALLDPPTVLGWLRWRELDERHSLGGLRAALGRLADEGRIDPDQAEIAALMLLAALNEAALFIAHAEDQPAALRVAGRSLDTLVDRLFD